jgi:hypothetical protein
MNEHIWQYTSACANARGWGNFQIFKNGNMEKERGKKKCLESFGTPTNSMHKQNKTVGMGQKTYLPQNRNNKDKGNCKCHDRLNIGKNGQRCHLY